MNSDCTIGFNDLFKDYLKMQTNSTYSMHEKETFGKYYA